MFIDRHITKAIQAADRFFPALLLTGARQVGKTTILRKLAGPDRKYVTFDDADLRTLAKEDPKGFLDRFSPPVLLDEIQYVPSLLSYIKMVIDEERFRNPDKARGMFWLTGSQQFELMQGVSDSLAGRICVFDMGGISQAELAGRENVPFTPSAPSGDGRRPGVMELFRRIWRGTYPDVLEATPEERNFYYSSYITTYLERDIRNLKQVHDLDRFYKLICSCAARTGQMLNASELARDAGIDVTTAQDWLAILQASHIIHLLPPYASSLTARLVKTPKLYFLDTGLCSYLTHWPTPETLEAGAMAGHIFETWCVSEVIKTYWNAGMKIENLFYYRDRDQREIDLVIDTAEGFHPAEIKKTSTPKGDDARHFRLLEKLGKPVLKGAVLCACETPVPLPNKDVVCIPASDI
ncbi:MAG: ATP-binding protein [Victivallales bacterium]|nr:ATP-binding protein [Victivallales bacterium]